MARCPAHGNRIQQTPSGAVNQIGVTPQPDCRGTEHDLSHAVYLFFTASIFDCWAKLTGAAGYGEPLLEAPHRTASG